MPLITRTVQATEAKARLAELLRQVERGESIAITRHGKPIAHLIPPQNQRGSAREAAVDRFLERRKQWRKTGMTREEILASRHEGHRF